MDQINLQATIWIDNARAKKNKSIQDVENYERSYRQDFQQAFTKEQLAGQKEKMHKSIAQYHANMKSLNDLAYDSRMKFTGSEFQSDSYQEILTKMEVVNVDTMYLQKRQEDLDRIEEEVQQLQEIVNQMKELVDAQDAKLDKIQLQVTTANRNIHNPYQSSIFETDRPSQTAKQQRTSNIHPSTATTQAPSSLEKEIDKPEPRQQKSCVCPIQ